MKALLIGYGSIARKHESILNQLGVNIKIVSRRPDIGAYTNLMDALQEDYDLAVITTETASHISILNKLLDQQFSNPIFIEKPLSITCQELNLLGERDNIWVGYNLRFHPAITFIKNFLDSTNENLSYAHFHVGQLLSSWRAGRDVRTTYSAQKRLGGGVVHDLSHEIDLASWLFGEIEIIKSKIGRFGNVTVDSDDLCMMIGATKKVPLISMNLNYLDHALNRSLQITGERSSLLLDLVRSTVCINDSLTSYPNGMEISYLTMWRHMIEICSSGKSDIMCGLKSARKVQKFIDTAYADNKQKCI